MAGYASTASTRGYTRGEYTSRTTTGVRGTSASVDDATPSTVRDLQQLLTSC